MSSLRESERIFHPQPLIMKEQFQRFFRACLASHRGSDREAEEESSPEIMVAMVECAAFLSFDSF